MKNLVLHIGTHKTGSSAIQRFLSTNRQLLEKNGFYYPCDGSYYLAGESSQSLLAHALLGMRPKYIKRHIEFTKESCIDDIRRDLQNTRLKNVIVSSEHFSSAKTTDELQLIRDTFAPVVSSTKVVIYIRRQDHNLESTYNQLTKQGQIVESFEEFAKENGGQRHIEYLNKLSEVFGKPNLIVRPFERKQLIRGDIVRDFTSLLGIDIGDELPKAVNESIPIELCEIIRLFGRNFGTYEKRMRFNSFIRSMPFAFDRTKYTVCSNEMRKAILEKHRAGNSAVAREYLGRDDGMLFYETEASDLPIFPGLTPERVAEIAGAIWTIQNRALRNLAKIRRSEHNSRLEQS